MEYISLDKIRNPYPLDKQKKGGVLSQTYGRAQDGRIINQGESPIVGEFPSPPTRGITAVPGTSFKFILEIDGTRYTSPEFASYLNSAQAENNPYFNESTVATIRLSSSQLSNPPRKYSAGLKYAETTIQGSSKLYSGDPLSIVKYIDSLAQPSKGLGNVELVDVKELGSWKTSITNYDAVNDSGMGVDYTTAVELEKKEGQNK
jgi:hypothetical protein